MNVWHELFFYTSYIHTSSPLFKARIVLIVKWETLRWVVGGGW